MTVRDLEEWTGKDRKTHYRHLRALCGSGLLAKAAHKKAHGEPEYLLGSAMLPQLQSWVMLLNGGAEQLPAGDWELEPPDVQMGENDPSGATTTTIDKTLLTSGDILNTVVVEGADVPKVPIWTDDEKVTWRVCFKIGIGEPMRSKIARGTDYPAEGVLAHGLHGANQSMDIALVIHRIKSHDWLPETVKEEARSAIGVYYHWSAEDDERSRAPWMAKK